VNLRSRAIFCRGDFSHRGETLPAFSRAFYRFAFLSRAVESIARRGEVSARSRDEIAVDARFIPTLIIIPPFRLPHPLLALFPDALFRAEAF